ncbi:MAG: hypothetical protein L0Z62_25110 [Gemmataceae bacterium]|nr:hypothetical protein [Gemmataceae bacterium]
MMVGPLRSLAYFLSVAALLLATTPGLPAQIHRLLLRAAGQRCDAQCACHRLLTGRSTCPEGCTCRDCCAHHHEHHHQHDEEQGEVDSLCPSCPFCPAGTCHGRCPGQPPCSLAVPASAPGPWALVGALLLDGAPLVPPSHPGALIRPPRA